MGVQGLWSLLQPVARPIKIETLEGKRLAIDSSLWLYHFQMAMRDNEGRTLSNAHILGFLWRILKLLFHGVRPVFVFDGGAPVMKRKTLSGRKARKQGAKESHARTAEKLLAAQMRQAALRHIAEEAPAPNANEEAENTPLDVNTVYYDDLEAGRPRPIPSPGAPGPSREKSSSPSKPRKDWHKDPYALPQMDKDLHQLAAANGRKGKRKDYRFATEDELRAVMNTIAPEDLDTTSELFRSLPPELQYELVGDLRTQSRMTSYKRLQSMLATAPTPIDFSRAQIAGLKTRNDLTQKVLTVTDEIGNANIKVPIRVAGERNKEYVLVRNPGAEGGFVLGVRDAGATKEKAIDIDQEQQDINITDDEKDEDSAPEIEMDDVEIPAPSPQPVTTDAETQELLKEADPYKRKEKAMELLQARARYHAQQKRKEAGIVDHHDLVPERKLRRPGDAPLFINQRAVRKASTSYSVPTSEDASDHEDELEVVNVDDDDDHEVEQDEADDLARALAESQHQADLRRSPSATVPVESNDEDMDEADFEDVQPQAPVPLQEVDSQPELKQPGAVAQQSRMDELAAMVRRKPSSGMGAPPPPRKSLAGSLRSARRSASHTHPDEKKAPASESIPAVASEIEHTPPSPVSATETMPAAKQQRMGPPVRSASQQRFESAGTPVDVTSRSASPGLPRPEVAQLPVDSPDVQREEVKEEEQPEIVETMAAVAAGAGINDEIDDAIHPDSITTAAPAPEDAPATEDAANVDQEPLAQEQVTRQPVDDALVDEDEGSGSTAAPSNVAVDNVPTAITEVSAVTPADEDAQSEPSRQGTPLDWSPTPSPEPVVLGADGFPLPTAEELDALDADDDEIARLNADQNEFAAFLSATKGRSLIDVQREVESEVNALRAEFANSRRTEEDITKQMAQEIQMMLRLFGLPYITAPMEAEAQCAELVSRRLVDGIITDDSDVFLFGGTRIYKNMFNQNKIVECFLLSDMQRELGLDREKLVRLAYYLGSDYTEGLAGVGPVVAMELLALFPGQDGLLKFRDWWLRVQMGKDTEEDTRGKTMRRIKKNLRNKVHLEPTWPQAEVLDAYYEPAVDESDEPFAWGLPDLDSLRTFLGEYLHWAVPKTDQYLLPIIERQNARNKARGNQSTLDRNGFFDTSAGTGVYAGRKKITYGSNRLQEVINGFRAANKARSTTPAQRPKKKRAGAKTVARPSGPRTSSSSSSDEGAATRQTIELSSSSSDDNDVIQAVDSRRLNVSEEQLGKEMAKKKPIVRREEANALYKATGGGDRLAELDAAIAALEGNSSPKKAAKPPRKRTKVLSETNGPNNVAEPARSEAIDTRSSGSSSSSEADEWRPAGKKRGTNTTKSAATTTEVARQDGKGRGRGRGGSTRGRARGRGGKANLTAARNMSLDDVHSLPPSRSPSVDPARLRARSRSSSTSTR